MTGHPLSRREFLRVSTAVGGGLLIRISLASASTRAVLNADQSPTRGVVLNAFVELGIDGAVTITVPSPEIGQGVRTALPMIVAEELGVAWANVQVRQGRAGSQYGGMTVGGSDSVRDYWEPLRLAGATAREMLRSAAAMRWVVEPTQCLVRDGWVVHPETGRRVSFGEVAAEAAQLPLPNGVPLKQPEEFEIVGTRVGGIDVPSGWKPPASAIRCRFGKRPSSSSRRVRA